MTKIALTKKYKTYPEYKATGTDWLEQVPAEWEMSKLRRLFRIKKEIAKRDGIDVLSITQKGVKRKDTQSNEGQLSNDYSKYQMVKRGDFAMNQMDLLTGFVDISPFDGVVSPDYRVFVPRRTDLADRYFLYLFQMGYQRKIFYAYGRGAAQFGRWRFPAEEFKNFLFPVPSTKEQKRIADFLDEKTVLIDRIIEKKQRLIELLKEKRAAVINHAVTKGLDPKVKMVNSGVEWVGAIPQKWSISYLREVAVPRQEKNSSGANTNLLSLSYGEIVEKDIHSNGGLLPASFETYQIVHRDDIVLRLTDLQNDKKSMRVGLVRSLDGIITSAYTALVLKTIIDARYAYYLLHAYDIQKVFYSMGGGVRQSIDFRNLKYLPILLPPRDEQEAIINYLETKTSCIDQIMTKEQASILSLQEFKSSLISHAVTGKIRV